MTDLEIHPITEARWGDLVELFGTRGDPSWCWCQYFLTTGNEYRASAEHNRYRLRSQVASATRPPGLLAYTEPGGSGTSASPLPVGWVQLGPRVSFPRVCENRAMAQAVSDLGDETVWAVTCFVVKVGYRRRGVSAALLAAAIDAARQEGARAVVGHPVDVAARPGRVSGAELYHGVASTFAAAGFTEVGRTAPHRPVVRLTL